ncbi:MAG: glycosyltransferase [Acidimicrobiales bacterium]
MNLRIGRLDVVALSSRNEGTPVALIEALACRRPVVATAVGGVATVVRDGETGLVVPPGDPVALASAIERMLSDPDRSAEMAARGRDDVGCRFTDGRLERDMRSLYREMTAM